METNALKFAEEELVLAALRLAYKILEARAKAAESAEFPHFPERVEVASAAEVVRAAARRGLLPDEDQN